MRLNIASGANVFPRPWVNTDLTDIEEQYLRHLRGLDLSQMGGWPPEQVALSQAITRGDIVFVQRDLLKGFPDYEDGSCEALYAGQLVEHLNPIHELPRFLGECWRLLKVGGVMRITTPCLGRILSAYMGKTLDSFASEQPDFYRSASPEMQLSYLMFGASGPGCTRTNYEGHFHCWAEGDLIAMVKSVGFRSVVSARTPTEPFAQCQDFGLSHSMALEATK